MRSDRTDAVLSWSITSFGNVPIGQSEIYNPWSVLNCVKSGFIPGDYWTGTSGNSIINNLLNKKDGPVFDDLKVLAKADR